MARIEIRPGEDVKSWEEEIRDAQASRGNLRVRRIIPLPGGKKLIIRGKEIDADPDVYR